MSVLFGKCSIQLLKATLVGGDNQFTHPVSWLLTIVFLTCAVSAVAFLNIGLRRGAALLVVPLYYVLNTLLAIVGGLVYFEEFKAFAPLQAACFASGVGMTVAGVYISSRGQAALDEEEEGEAEDEIEEARRLQQLVDGERQKLLPTTTEEGDEVDDDESLNPVDRALRAELRQEAEERALEELDRRLLRAGAGEHTPPPLSTPSPNESCLRKPSDGSVAYPADGSGAAAKPRKLSVRFGMEGLGPAQGVMLSPEGAAAGSAAAASIAAAAIGNGNGTGPRMARTRSALRAGRSAAN